MNKKDIVQLMQKDNHKRIDERKWFTTILTSIISAIVVAITIRKIDTEALQPLCISAIPIIGFMTIVVMKLNLVIKRTQRDINKIIRERNTNAAIELESISQDNYNWFSIIRWFSVTRSFSFLFIIAFYYLLIFALFTKEIYLGNRINIPSHFHIQAAVYFPVLLIIALFIIGIIKRNKKSN